MQRRLTNYLSLATLALIFLAGATLAQEPPLDAELLEEEAPEIRRYTVELIVFRYAEKVSVGSEIFQPEIIEPVVPEEIPATDELDDVADDVANDVDDKDLEEEGTLFEMVLLAEDELTLLDTYDRLDRLDAYEPLLHVGWTQTALPEADSPRLDLREFGEPPVDLHGAFTLYLSRYLHLVVNLELDAENDDTRQFIDVGLVYDEPMYAPLSYVIDENRLFKNGETRYYDHPMFGVIAKILRFEEPEEEDVPDDTEFLSPAVAGNKDL